MGYLDEIKGISSEAHNRFTIIMGESGSGKTTLAGTFPKPMLVVSVSTDGGTEVLKKYSDDEVKILSLENTPQKHTGAQLLDFLNEVALKKQEFKTVVIDAYSTIEEDVAKYLREVKGKELSLNERGAIKDFMLIIRDKIAELSRQNREEYVLIVHTKEKDDVNSTTGETTKRIIPKMSINNGNILLERASNVMYCAIKTVIKNNVPTIQYLTYIGAHPNMSTKLRTTHGMDTRGLYISEATFDKIEQIRLNGNKEEEELQIKEKTTSVKDDDDWGEFK